MRIGCPKEIKPQEFRVGLTPDATAEAVAHGHTVLIETGAGLARGSPMTIISQPEQRLPPTPPLSLSAPT